MNLPTSFLQKTSKSAQSLRNKRLLLHRTEADRRLVWALTRSILEADIYKHLRYGEKRRRHWSLFEFLIRMFGVCLKAFRLHQRGYHNATGIVINRERLHFGNLPAPFHGYTLLHLTDLHADFISGYENIICESIKNLSYDACVMTGDYRKKISGSIKTPMKAMEKITSTIRAKDGIFATFGNHDTYRMAEPFEKMGITILPNESIYINRNNSRIQITGIDDPYYYYTDQALTALEETEEGFKIALVHTPSLYDVAAENRYQLYLCGHTHGGQICLPGGYPIILHLRYGRKYYRGLWRYRKMTGYTSQGCGTIGIPIRFNTVSEVTLITLLKG
ncbi:metallophosphoesterase [Desulfosarcina sp.]|uniref:metallophosphoesterase n=1 Tax=Desulfosarcina sp. TaxID=2027861 RepID=UPI0029AA5EEA|nr:metallophosphoesterase [Desulfosarcina sp.]MDX2455798.1 metallophosphoesterase [Desulfosarcina sp.]MDX2493260.1 metallophosphoesterase [Desulfosarcina sp.]